MKNTSIVLIAASLAACGSGGDYQTADAGATPAPVVAPVVAAQPAQAPAPASSTLPTPEPVASQDPVPVTSPAPAPAPVTTPPPAPVTTPPPAPVTTPPPAPAPSAAGAFRNGVPDSVAATRMVCEIARPETNWTWEYATDRATMTVIAGKMRIEGPDGTVYIDRPSDAEVAQWPGWRTDTYTRPLLFEPDGRVQPDGVMIEYSTGPLDGNISWVVSVRSASGNLFSALYHQAVPFTWSAWCAPAQ